MTVADEGLRFWLDYVDAAGGLWEDTGDSAVVLLPEPLQQACGGTDQLVVTSDPDVAREDGATLLAAGHPFLIQAAETVLDAGDCGAVRVPSPPGAKQPSTDQLLTWARDRFPVDHGKIDATMGASPGVRYVLRVGALASYAVSDDHFQEQVERWVDVASRLTLPDDVVARLRRSVYDEHQNGDAGLPPPAELTAALAYAHEQVGAFTRERAAELSAQLGDAHTREAQRATAYYDEALRSLQRRLDTATPERAGGLSARMTSTRAERDRRLAEIAEKYRPQTTVRPFRLHVVGVPVMRLPVDVRRGDRRFPLTLDWLLPARTFAGLRCPHCASTEPLSVAKTRLGCRQCLAKPTLERPAAPASTPAPSPPRSTDGGPAPPAAPARATTAAKDAEPTTHGQGPSPRSRSRRAGTPSVVRRSPTVVQKAGRKLVNSLWDLTANGDRRVRRLLAPSSPASAMHELFGSAGAVRAIGVGADEQPLASYQGECTPAEGDTGRFLIAGELECSRLRYRFQLCWRFYDDTPLAEEITPFAHAPWPQMFDLGSALGHLGVALTHPNPAMLHATEPGPRAQLDPIADALWQRGMPVRGLPVVLRCLAAWWRLEDRDQLADAYSRSVLAAAVDRMVAYRSGATRGARYTDAARTYQVDVDAVRKVSTVVQRRLQLSTTQPW